MAWIRKNLWQSIFLFTWLVVILVGFACLSIYSNTPSTAAHAAAQWPSGTTLKRSSDKATLVLFVHPRCACSDASLGELERLLPQTNGKMESMVVFVKPENFNEDWAKQRLWNRSLAMPGIVTLLDEEGREADRFGAKTSGQAFLFASDGRLVFSGGITPGRGHMGDNDGRAAVLDFIAGKPERITRNPVFGCALFSAQRGIAGVKK